MSNRSLAVRSFDLAHAAPFLERAWERIRNDDPDAELWVANQPNKHARRLPHAIQSSEITTTSLPAHAYEAIVSWSIPNERTMEDSLLAGPGIEFVPGPLSAVYALADKRVTKSLLDRFGIPTPRGVTLDRGFTEGGLLQPRFRRSLEQRLVAGLHYPLIVKPLWDCLGHGTEIIHDREQLTSVLARTDQRDLLVEEFLDGQAGTIEIVGEPDDYYIQPPCWSGPSADTWSGLEGIRIAHPSLFGDLLSDDFISALTRLLAELNFRGACCVDFVANESTIQILEINPRVSGASALSAAATGVSAFEETYRIARSQWGTRTRNTRPVGAAVQAGGEWAERLEHVVRENRIPVQWYRDTHLGVDGRGTRSILVGGDTDAVQSVVSALNLVALWPGVSSILETT